MELGDDPVAVSRAPQGAAGIPSDPHAPRRHASMRLARKLALALVLGIFAVMAAYAYVQVRREVSVFESDLDASARRGRALLVSFRAAWRDGGEERARALVDEIGSVLGDEVQSRWIRLDATGENGPSVELDPTARAALAAGEVHWLIHTTRDGEMRRYAYIPMAVGEPTILEASVSLRDQQTFIRMSHETIVFATVVIALVCGVIALLLGVRFVGRPVTQIVEQARRMGMGDFSHRLAIAQSDEIGELSADMNQLCDRLTAARDAVAAATEARITALEQLRHADRLATVGQLASGVAHELGTPLSVVSARAEMLRAGDAAPAEVVETGAVIVEQTARMTAIIRQLLDLSRRRGPQLGVADVRPIVTRTAGLLATLARSQNVVVDIVTPPEPLLVEVDPSQLQQALSHVVMNAIQSMPTGGRASIRMRTCEAQPPTRPNVPRGEYVCITVEDEGSGIAPEHLPRVFEPFFTTKDAGRGTGLGLSVTEGILRDHHGWIAVASVVGRGSRFDVYLPLRHSAAHAQAI